MNYEKYTTEPSSNKYNNLTNQSIQEFFDRIDNTIVQSSNQTSKKMLRNQAIVTEEVKEPIDQRYTQKLRK